MSWNAEIPWDPDEFEPPDDFDAPPPPDPYGQGGFATPASAAAGPAGSGPVDFGPPAGGATLLAPPPPKR
ncbi:hypothetical protein E3T58_16355, partial [Cryobacterium sp. TMB3-12]